MSKKLLHKTLQFYALLAVVVLVVSAPLFYYLTQKLFIEDADEALLLRKQEFLQNNQNSLKIIDIPLWNTFNRDVKIDEADAAVKKDTIFYRFYIDSLSANENEPYRVLLSHVTIEGRPYQFMARINLVESEDVIKSVALLFCATLTALLLGLYFITRRLSAILWRPFYSTLQQVERFELDKNRSPEFVSSDIEEFTRLNQSVGRMMERNAAAYRNQKEFIENAAHELQTPIASFRAKLDALVQQFPFTEELSVHLSNLNEAVSQVTRINKNLLLLSKIENNQFVVSEQVSISDVLQKQVTFLKEQVGEKQIKIRIQDLEPLTLEANSTLLEIAVSNLLLNALRHNRPGGGILVNLHQRELSITNSGINSALDSKRLFERFSNPGPDGGNGLGLSIVKKISDLHGWTLTYTYEDEMHVFKVIF